jgi:hypothetical protein
MKVYKVTITGVVTTDDDEGHPNSWSWDDKDIRQRFREMGLSTNIVINEMKEVTDEVATVA